MTGRAMRRFAGMEQSPRWFTETDDGHSQWYAEHFRELAATGSDVDGEARLIDAMVAPHSRILDAGCGQGRTAAALHRRGHQVVGVDIDPVLIEAARSDYPDTTFVLADLAGIDLSALGQSAPFDAAVCAGNVITFVAPGTETAVLRAIRSVLRPDGRAVFGFHTERYDLSDFDAHLHDAGFELESRFATWDLRPWQEDADFVVSVLRVPSGVAD